ncbi:phage N-6-adenine-methyltransferase [Luteibacter aegosomatissinici]|uniref:phage N-6-adenine-methyltransferase n=1 Tax=Luteibacter aegosomatissinici TaxID=2911539 RepID=UPI001FFA4375|nr:phage N-6-adenine-methyltransferase [Luteibacter aegosomatissinici]UPG92792.1 phage N-6-adenine-methyltransferase [Luteibacter aegosomatissinici]
MARTTKPAARTPIPSRTSALRTPGNQKSAPLRGFQHDRTKGEETWLTPRWLVDALDLPHNADVDPCAPPVRHWKTARRHFNKVQDGFNRPWDPAHFYWVNPPYGAECGKWMARLADHGNGLLLVFARTDTAAFHESVIGHPNVAGVFFIRGRLKFANGAGEQVGTAGAPSMLVAYGRRALTVIRRAMRDGALEGHLLELSK